VYTLLVQIEFNPSKQRETRELTTSAFWEPPEIQCQSLSLHFAHASIFIIITRISIHSVFHVKLKNLYRPKSLTNSHRLVLTSSHPSPHPGLQGHRAVSFFQISSAHLFFFVLAFASYCFIFSSASDISVRLWAYQPRWPRS